MSPKVWVNCFGKKTPLPKSQGEFTLEGITREWPGPQGVGDSVMGASWMSLASVPPIFARPSPASPRTAPCHLHESSTCSGWG